jgi:hypothetical protein
MGSSTGPTSRARVPAPDDHHGRLGSGSFPSAATATSGTEKTNPIEPIEVKPWRFKQMSQILRNRAHSNHLPCFQMVTGKFGPISGNCGPSRTATAAALVAHVLRSQGPVQNKAGMSFRFNSRSPVSPLPRPIGQGKKLPKDRLCLLRGRGSELGRGRSEDRRTRRREKRPRGCTHG